MQSNPYVHVSLPDSFFIDFGRDIIRTLQDYKFTNNDQGISEPVSKTTDRFSLGVILRYYPSFEHILKRCLSQRKSSVYGHMAITNIRESVFHGLVHYTVSTAYYCYGCHLHQCGDDSQGGSL